MKFNKLLWGASIIALFCIGCDSDNDSKDVNANQLPSAQGNQNDGEGTSTGDNNSSAKPSNPTPPSDETGNGDGENTSPDIETKKCDPACPAGQSCVDGACVTPTDDCGNTCDDGHICQNGVCIAKSEPEPSVPKTCSNDSPCDAGYSCISGQCVAGEPNGCAPECKAGFACINGECIENTASDKPDKQNCNKDVACDPSAVCVSNYYCVELCGEGENIYQNIDILYEASASQGDDNAQGFELIKDKESLDAYINKNHLTAIVDIDFTKDAVLAINKMTTSMGIAFHLRSACDIAGVSTFTAYQAYCASEGMDAAIDWKWIMVKVPKDGNYDVKFETNDHYCVK